LGSLYHQRSGDAEHYSRQAAASGVDVVAAYGGDGTVMEARAAWLAPKHPWQSCRAVQPT